MVWQDMINNSQTNPGFNANSGSSWQQNPSLPAPSGPGQSYGGGMTPGWAINRGGAPGGFNGQIQLDPGEWGGHQQPMPRPWQPRPMPPTQGGQLPFDSPGGWEKPMPQPWFPGAQPPNRFGDPREIWGQFPPDHTMPMQPYQPPQAPNLGQAGLDAAAPFLDMFRKPPMQSPANPGGSAQLPTQLPLNGGRGESMGPGPMMDGGGMISPAQRAPLDQNMDGIDDRIFQAQQKQTQLDAQMKMKQLESKREVDQLSQTRKMMEQRRKQQEQLLKQQQQQMPIGQFGNSWNQFQDTRRKFMGQNAIQMNSPLAGNGSFARSYGTPEGSLPRNTAPVFMR